MLTTLLIANRGAIACRILRTLRTMKIRGAAVYSEADISSLHIREADEALSLGDGPAANTYLDSTKIIAAAKASGAQAIHPGYGFLSENAEFAEACDAAGIAFVGPTPEQLRLFGLKHTARALAKTHGVALLGAGPAEGIVTPAGIVDNGQQGVTEAGVQDAATREIGVVLTAQCALCIVTFTRVIGIVEQRVDRLVTFQVEQAQRLP